VETTLKVLLIGKRDESGDLRALLRDLPAVGFVEVGQALYMNPPSGLDAVLLTLPAAERWSPDFKSRKAQVLKTSDKDREQGFPPSEILKELMLQVESD
jgi:hypothetical protein